MRVRIVNNRCLAPEEWAKMAVSKMLHAAEGTHPAIREQANDFRGRLEKLTAYYIAEAVHERRARDAALAEKAGARCIAEAIRLD